MIEKTSISFGPDSRNRLREVGRWRQYHHHGSIDDPAALQAYQLAIRG
jgi:hypothetical protein